MHDVPDELEVDAIVVVNQAVSHAGHGSPLHLGMLSSKFFGDMLRGFADDLVETADRGSAISHVQCSFVVVFDGTQARSPRERRRAHETGEQSQSRISANGGVDGTRTRGLRRDRPAF